MYNFTFTQDEVDALVYALEQDLKTLNEVIEDTKYSRTASRVKIRAIAKKDKLVVSALLSKLQGGSEEKEEDTDNLPAGGDMPC